MQIRATQNTCCLFSRKFEALLYYYSTWVRRFTDWQHDIQCWVNVEKANFWICIAPPLQWLMLYKNRIPYYSFHLCLDILSRARYFQFSFNASQTILVGGDLWNCCLILSLERIFIMAAMCNVELHHKRCEGGDLVICSSGIRLVLAIPQNGLAGSLVWVYVTLIELIQVALIFQTKYHMNS